MLRVLHLYHHAFRGLSREVWLLAIAMFINRSGAMVLPFLSLYLTKQLEFTLAEAGWVLSSFGLGSLAGNWLGGQLTDRWHAYGVQVASLALCGLMFLLLMQLETLYAWCAAFFLTSLVGDALRPANMAAVAQYSKPEDLTRSIALQRLAFNLGFAAGPVTAGWLAHQWGYHTLFWVDAATCLLAALFLAISLPKPRPSASKKEEEDEDTEATAAESPPSSVFHDRHFVVFVLMQFVMFLGFMQFFTTLPVFLEERLAMNEGEIGTLMALNGLIIVIIEMPLIPWLEGRYRALQLIRLGNLLVAVSLLLLIGGDIWVGFIWLYIIGITIGEIVNFPFGSTYALSFSKPHNRGRYMGAYGLCVSGGFVVAPWLGTQLADWLGWNVLWILMAGCVLLAALGITWVDRQRLSAAHE